MRPLVRDCLLLSAIVLLATALRLYRIDAQSLWFDEGIAADAATQATLARVVSADPTNPPLYFLILHLATRLVGDDLLALRAVSVLIGLAVVPLTYLLARALFGPTAGLFAALLAAGSAPLWWAAQELRMYGLLAALVALAALGWHRVVSRPTRRAWLLVLGAELLLLYTHSTGPVAALWLNAVTLLAWVVRRDVRRPDWRAWVAGQAVVALLWSPWFVTRFVLLPAVNQVVAAPPTLEPALFGRIWQALWTAPWALVDREPALVGLTALLGAITLLVVPWRRPAARWLMVHLAVLVAGLLAGLTIVGIGLHGRYLVMLVPLLLVALAGGLARLSTLRQTRLRVVAPALVVLPFLATGSLSVHLATRTPGYAHDDTRAMVQYYADHLSAEDTVLAWAYTRDRFELAYYWDRLGVRARRVLLPEGADAAEVAALLPKGGTIALNVWYAQVADQRGMLPCALADGTANPPAQFTVNGMSTLLFSTPARAFPELRPLDATFGVARVTEIGLLPERSADRAACVPVRITLTRPVPRPLKAALIVKNGLGWEIARADATFARADQKTSDRLGPGESLTAYPLLRLPYGAPAGAYPVLLRLYDEGALSGYDLLAGPGTPVGKDLAVGTWVAQPAADWRAVSRRGDLPNQAALPVGSDLTLLAHDADPARALSPGARLPLTLLWQGAGSLPTLTLAAEDGSWQVERPAGRGDDRAAVRRDWREFPVPATARDGAAELRLPDGTVVARYAVKAPPAQLSPPDFGVPVGARLPGVGELAGYTLDGSRFDRSEPVPITLVWRAGAAPAATSYTVFVQLLNASGRLIAQSDAIPAQGARPTTGWRPGEYVVDPHRLTFHPDAAPGPAMLVVGMYDATTGARVPYENGATFVTLLTDAEVR